MSHSHIFEAGRDAPVVYEITVRVEPAIVADFAAYMTEKHIADLLETGHFISASIARNDDELRISYIAKSRTELDVYLEKHSSRLRAEVMQRFPAVFRIERREWELLGILKPA